MEEVLAHIQFLGFTVNWKYSGSAFQFHHNGSISLEKVANSFQTGKLVTAYRVQKPLGIIVVASVVISLGTLRPHPIQ